MPITHCLVVSKPITAVISSVRVWWRSTHSRTHLLGSVGADNRSAVRPIQRSQAPYAEAIGVLRFSGQLERLLDDIRGFVRVRVSVLKRHTHRKWCRSSGFQDDAFHDSYSTRFLAVRARELAPSEGSRGNTNWKRGSPTASKFVPCGGRDAL